jgi:hypothetical protein
MTPFAASAALGLVSVEAAAQQFVTDDAYIVERNACQLEAWHGEASSWILPACHFIPGVEITAGVGFVAHGDHRDTEYLFQGKVLLREPPGDGVAISAVLGFGFDPHAQALRNGPASVYAYVPATLTARGGDLALHLNAGWMRERHEAAGTATVSVESPHALTWGAAVEAFVAGPLTAMAEVFGEDRHLPGFTVGANVEVLPERLSIDLTWGGHTAAGVPGSGWALGGAWTPGPLLPTADRDASPQANLRKGR